MSFYKWKLHVPTFFLSLPLLSSLSFLILSSLAPLYRTFSFILPFSFYCCSFSIFLPARYTFRVHPWILVIKILLFIVILSICIILIIINALRCPQPANQSPDPTDGKPSHLSNLIPHKYFRHNATHWQHSAMGSRRKPQHCYWLSKWCSVGLISMFPFLLRGLTMYFLSVSCSWCNKLPKFGGLK